MCKRKRSQKKSTRAVPAAACGGWCADLQLGFFRRAIRDEPLRGLIFYRASAVRHCELNINSIVVLEHFLLVCKRKRSQKKNTRAVPARHPTAAAQTRTRRLFSPCSAHAPANSISLRQCGLVRSALPPVPSPRSGSSAVCAAACGGWCADLQLGFFRRAIRESPYGVWCFFGRTQFATAN